MSRAEVRDVPPDPERASDFLAQARRFLDDADLPDLSLPGTCFLLYQACIAAMDAVLVFEGRVVGSGEASHIVRIGETLRLTGGSYAELFERLQDEWRDQRGEVSYGALVPPAAEVDSQRADTRELVEIASAHIKR
jgi:hypothetical protein